MADWPQELLMVEPPRGMYPARCDEKGRIKLPAAFQQYFAALREKKLFVTSLDRRIGQIYPMAVWRQNEKFFEQYREDPIAAEDISFNANDLGCETEMDGQGRVLCSSDLRREIGIENQPVRLFAHRGRIQILTESIYEERKQRAAQRAAENVAKLEAAGLN